MAAAARLDLVEMGSVAGGQDYRQPARRRLLGEDQPALAGQTHVGNENVVIRIARQCRAHLGGIRRQGEMIALRREEIAQELADVAIVLDDQHLADLLPRGDAAHESSLWPGYLAPLAM